MDFFDQVAKKISSGTNIASKKADELIAAAELKMTISRLENDIDDAIYQLGESVYNYYISNNGTPVNEIQMKCREIQRMYQSISKLRKNYNAYKGLYGCKYCGATIEEGNIYCPNCGNKIY